MLVFSRPYIHRGKHYLLAPNHTAPTSDNSPPLINLEPTSNARVQLLPEASHQNMHANLQQATTNHAFFSGKPMNVDTSVVFFSHTTSAKLTELRRQSLAQSACLTNKQVVQTTPREMLDKFIAEYIIRDGMRITTALNTEPAKRNMKENERIIRWFCIKFKVGHGKSKVDVMVTLPPHRPVLRY